MSLVPTLREEETSIGGGTLAGRDLRVAAAAQVRLGLVTGEQLEALGYSTSAIARAVRRGRLHPRYRGVYSVGHTVLRREAYWLAAVLACGSTAVLSHRSAAVLWTCVHRRAHVSTSAFACVATRRAPSTCITRAACSRTKSPSGKASR